MTADKIKDILEYLRDLEEDSTVPRNVKSKIDTIIRILNGDEQTELKINKALDELDEVANDGNLQTYTRTQIWNVVSMLENI